MGVNSYDFSGWATKNDLLCADGRTIRKGAFKDCDGQRVPLVWNHQHNDPTNVLGHALLENREEGVYAYCSFNNTELAQKAKESVAHGDITALSIFANKLKQQGSNVLHGAIREVSLVLAGANPGAFIDSVLEHGEFSEESGIIYTDEELVLFHSDEEDEKEKPSEEEEVEEETNEKSEEDEEEEEMEDEKKLAHSEEEAKSEKTVKDVVDSMTEEQKNVMYALVGQALEEAKGGSDESDEEEKDMKHNVFDVEQQNDDALMHDAMNTIIADGKRFGSLKESFLAHADDYGIKDIDWLFPEAKNVNGAAPGFIKRNPDAWVDVVMNGVHHTPFSRIKMMFADLREDEARAKGYVKGKLKKEEVFGLLKRTVEPTTIYKKQKLDRDDIIDIVDFDVVSWLKGEMRMMLDEEIARAILFGDGRTALSDDKISETNIIPIAKDAALYTLTESLPQNHTAKDIITAAVKGQNDYEGSGNTTMFIANTNVTDMLLIEDGMQHRMYKDVADLALACSVNRIVKVPASIIPAGIVALIVDLNDYNVGADKGGAINMFDDFDIDYNQQKYLIETRCSGALVKPFSAVVIKEYAAG